MPTKVLVGLGLLVAVLLAAVASQYASGSPDGLDRVAADQGFDRTASTHATQDGPLAGYRTDGVSEERVSAGIAGVAGVLVVLVLAGGLTYVVRRTTPDAADHR